MKSLLANRRMKILLSIIIIATLLFFVTNAWPKSTRYCIENQAVEQYFIPDSGTSWVNGNVSHSKDEEGGGQSIGDIEADISFIISSEFNFNTLNGHVYGTQELSDAVVYVDGDPMEGSFDGVYNVSITLNEQFVIEWEGRYVAHGSGDFEGMKLFQTVTGSFASDEEEYVGFILDPKGTLPDLPCP